MLVIGQLVKLLVIDAILVLVALLAAMLFLKQRHAARAVLKRNFVGYFSNPTGYVFLCLFVFLSSVGAFWPNEFFNSNLATLSELNRFFPYIMLVFIPAITMSIWTEERRQGTDELLLTIPAGDFDIVIGKYLAAAAIFSVSLLFSQISNFSVMIILAQGDVDVGLFVATHIGYWMVGLAMLAIGMVASFLTSNLTVGFILGSVLNAPLAFAASADSIFSVRSVAMTVSRWSYAAQFEDFGRGVIGLASVSFFVMLIVLGIYLSVVLIGRRHWLGGKDGQSLLGHYLVRTLALVVITIGLNLFFSKNDWVRRDITTEKISSLSPDTRDLIEKLDPTYGINVEAFISQGIPEQYVETKVDLIAQLNNLKAKGKNKINVNIYDNIEPFSEDATRAEEQYGIKPEMVMTKERGAFKQEEIFLGAAFTSGLEKVVIPFFGHGIPVEYELIRSICTVANQERKRLGVVRTDAQLFGGFDMQRMTPRPKQLIIEELEKQYEVVQIDPNTPIEEAVDVMMVVQPSSLNQSQLDNLVAAIRSGTPTAIFEDPFPVALTSAPGTGQPKRPRGNPMMGGGAPPEQKGDIKGLFSSLGVKLVGNDGFAGYDADIVWQEYNPYPKVRNFRQISKEWVFVGPDAPGAKDPLADGDSITSSLNQLLFLFPGGIEEQDVEGLAFTPIVSTGNITGTIKVQDINEAQGNPMMLDFRRKPRQKRFVLAARVKGRVSEGTSAGDAEETAAADANKVKDGDSSDDGSGGKELGEIDVVMVSDIDLLHSDFLQLRARPDGEINWQFDNVTFVLNIMDVLASDESFVEIRKRQTRHSTLKMVEERTVGAREKAQDQIAKFEEQFNSARRDAEKQKDDAAAELQKKVDELRQKAQEEGVGSSKELEGALIDMALTQQVAERRLAAKTERFQRQRDSELKRLDRKLDQGILQVQNRFKFWAGLLPPIPPLLLGLFVYNHRRKREKEGITDERRRSK